MGLKGNNSFFLAVGVAGTTRYTSPYGGIGWGKYLAQIFQLKTAWVA
jgi:hypothetical protein